jgi:hypothetical protein
MAASSRIIGQARSALLAVAVALALAGCEDFGNVSATDTDAGKIGVLLWREITGIGSSASVPRERAAAIPYASLGVRLGRSDESMFVLASRSGDDLLWLGGKRLAVTTRHGRVVRTVGFASNVSGVHLAGTSKQDFSQASVDYLYDFAEQSRYGIPVKCTRQNLGPEKIVIIGVAHDTSHITEDCNASGLDWSFQNEFWIDAAGYVWKSRQVVAPRFDAFSLEVLRPAGQ